MEGFCGGHDLNLNFWRGNRKKKKRRQIYQNYRNFDVVEVQIMDIYYFIKVLNLTGYFLYSAHLGVNKNLFD